MFKPTIEHLEELMRAKEICESLEDDLSRVPYGYSYCETCMNNAATAIQEVLEIFSDKIEALTP